MREPIDDIRPIPELEPTILYSNFFRTPRTKDKYPHMTKGQRRRLAGKESRDIKKEMIRSDPCSYCNRDGGTIDHIVPKVKVYGKGRGTDFWNHAGACRQCNIDKDDKDLLTYLLEIREN